MKLRSDYGQVHSEVKIWACPKCSFQGSAHKLKNQWISDPTVRSFVGVNFRWTFLAKSHVPKSRVKNGVFTYRCIFCVLSGVAAQDFQGPSPFIEHVASHRGQFLTELILHTTCCINDKVAAEEENFDVNLTPIRNGGSQDPIPQDRSSFETARTSYGHV